MDSATREAMRQLQYSMLLKLSRLAEQLPNGVLHRLVEDAEFYRDWSHRKKRARASGRLAQIEKARERLADAQWRARGGGGHSS